MEFPSPVWKIYQPSYDNTVYLNNDTREDITSDLNTR